MSYKDIVYATNHRRLDPCHPEDLEKAAFEASRRSTNQDLAAWQFWADIASAWTKTSGLLSTCIFAYSLEGKCLAEHVIEAGDWLSCRVFHGHLADGIYADGTIVKKGPYFGTVPDSEGYSSGIRLYDKYRTGGYYGGSFKHGQRHGHGVSQTGVGVIYYGDWEHDMMNGMGCFELGWPRKSKAMGQYVNGSLAKKNSGLRRAFATKREGEKTVWKMTETKRYKYLQKTQPASMHNCCETPVHLMSRKRSWCLSIF